MAILACISYRFSESNTNAMKESAINKHIRACNHLGTFAEKDLMDLVQDLMYNTNIVDSAHRWNVLLYKVALYIKRRSWHILKNLNCLHEMPLVCNACS